MKKFLAIVLTVSVGGACLCGNAVAVREETYCDSGVMPLAATSEKIYYENKSEDKFNMVLKAPCYTTSPYTASCACVAGANVIGFYDRYDENLIPNHTAGRVVLGQYVYNLEDIYITELVKQLYEDMGTDSTGTTVRQFKDGMTKFSDRKGKTITFTSCMKNGKLDYAAAKNYMKANQPVVLFCLGYNIANLSAGDKCDTVDYMEYTANHVMVGFGWKEVNYQLSATASAVYQYVEVASGTDGRVSGLYNVNYKTKINDAYAINIY